MIMKYKQAIHCFFFNYFLVIMFILCYSFDQKTGLHLLVTFTFND